MGKQLGILMGPWDQHSPTPQSDWAEGWSHENNYMGPPWFHRGAIELGAPQLEQTGECLARATR